MNGYSHTVLKFVAIAVFVGLIFGPVFISNKMDRKKRWLRTKAEVDAYTIAYVLGALAVALFVLAGTDRASFWHLASIIGYIALAVAPTWIPLPVFRELDRTMEGSNSDERIRTSRAWLWGFLLGNVGVLLVLWLGV